MSLSISIVIPTHRPEKLKQLLRSLKSMGYPKDKLEILVSYGENPSRQRNEAVKKATGDIIYFIDDDVGLETGIFPRVLEHYEDTQVAGVGGPNITPETDSFLQKCFGYVMQSFFGSASMRSRYKPVGAVKEATEKNLILCNFSIRRNILEKMKFDERLFPNEENELFNRLKSRGYKLLYDPDLVIYHSRRNDLLGFIMQLFGHGRGRAEQILIQRHSLSLLFFIPSLFLIYLFIPVIHTIYLLPTGLYLLFDILSSLNITIEKRDPRLLLILPFLYPIEHISYGFGFIWGFLNSITGKKRQLTKGVKVEKIML